MKIFACVAILFALPATAADLRGDWQLGLDLRGEGGGRVAGAVGQSGVRWRAADDWSLELLGRSGVLGAHDEVVDDQIYLGLAIGGAWTPRTGVGAWAPRVALRATHIHHATTDSWRDTPGANLAGTSSGGVVHRTGAELGVAALSPAFWRLGDWSVGSQLELTGGVLPGSEEMAWVAGLTLGLTFETVAAL